MNSHFEYQFNYGNPTAAPIAPRVDPDAPLFASEDGVVASLSNSECLFQVRRSGETHVMTFQVLQALDQSREFRSLDEHAARIMATIPGLATQREGVTRVLDGLVARGLLVSDRAFLARVASGGDPQPAPLRAVFIRACDRPEQLAQLLATLAEYERRHRASRPYVLIDDSSSRDAANRHRDLLREFARATGCKLTYIGTAELLACQVAVGLGRPQIGLGGGTASGHLGRGALHVAAQHRQRLAFFDHVTTLGTDAFEHPDHRAAQIGHLVGLDQAPQRLPGRRRRGRCGHRGACAAGEAAGEQTQQVSETVHHSPGPPKDSPRSHSRSDSSRARRARRSRPAWRHWLKLRSMLSTRGRIARRPASSAA